MTSSPQHAFRYFTLYSHICRQSLTGTERQTSVFTYTHRHTHARLYTHIHIHTHTHIYIYICMCFLSFLPPTHKSSSALTCSPLLTGQLCTSTHERAPTNAPIRLGLPKLYKAFNLLSYFIHIYIYIYIRKYAYRHKYTRQHTHAQTDTYKQAHTDTCGRAFVRENCCLLTIPYRPSP